MGPARHLESSLLKHLHVNSLKGVKETARTRLDSKFLKVFTDGQVKEQLIKIKEAKETRLKEAAERKAIFLEKK